MKTSRISISSQDSILRKGRGTEIESKEKVLSRVAGDATVTSASEIGVMQMSSWPWKTDCKTFKIHITRRDTFTKSQKRKTHEKTAKLWSILCNTMTQNNQRRLALHPSKEFCHSPNEIRHFFYRKNWE